MTIEYWLQKKTIGGWSHVTYYTDLEQAKRNYNSASEGDSGYSWRLVEVRVVECKMLEDVVEVAPSVVEPKPNSKTWVSPPVLKAAIVQDAPKSSGGGDVPSVSDFKASGNPGAVVLNSWGSNTALINGSNTPVNFGDVQHGLSGSVWVINHATKHKSRVPAIELESYLAKGYVKGGPRTQFEGN